MTRRVPASDWQVFDDLGRRKYLTAVERVRFLAAADHLAPDRRALCYLLAHTGCRISEGAQLAAHQVDAEGGRITLPTLK